MKKLSCFVLFTLALTSCSDESPKTIKTLDCQNEATLKTVRNIIFGVISQSPQWTALAEKSKQIEQPLNITELPFSMNNIKQMGYYQQSDIYLCEAGFKIGNSPISLSSYVFYSSEPAKPEQETQINIYNFNAEKIKFIADIAVQSMSHQSCDKASCDYIYAELPATIKSLAPQEENHSKLPAAPSGKTQSAK